MDVDRSLAAFVPSVQRKQGPREEHKKKEEARRGRHQKNGEEDVNCLDFRWKFAKARLLSVLVPRVSPALLQLVCTRSGFLHIFLCRVSRRLSLPAGSCARDRNTAGAPELSWTDSGGAGVAREGVFGKSFGTSVDGQQTQGVYREVRAAHKQPSLA